jgi:nicotinate phosphoribosyltransferase
MPLSTTDDLVPTNPLADPLLTDAYEFSMAYAWWKHGHAAREAVADLYFRRNPFGGEFTVFAGAAEVVRFLAAYRFSAHHLERLRVLLPADTDPAFFDWLGALTLERVRVRALREGSLAFPRVPLLIVEGPIAQVQLLETALLTLVNYASLIATAAARLRLAVGPDKRLLEFGLRRAPGVDGGISASRYAYLGGFDATSDLQAAALFPALPVAGTHAHAFVQSYRNLAEVRLTGFVGAGGAPFDLMEAVMGYRAQLSALHTNEGELAAFVAYAAAYPRAFLALVDTYDTLRSGLPNFLAVALALHQAGYAPLGIRLDSGDLAFLSRQARAAFAAVSARFGVPFAHLRIVASNDLDETTIRALNSLGHQIDTFGIGTHLVMPGEPLGAVYKVVAVEGQPRIKVSGDPAKTTLPGRKNAYRLFAGSGSSGSDTGSAPAAPVAVVDLMTLAEEEAPQVGRPVLCRHPFDETKRVLVTPRRVDDLYTVVWEGAVRSAAATPLDQARAYVLEQLAQFREDHLRPVNPTPYKVSVSARLYDFLHDLLASEVPIAEIH